MSKTEEYRRQLKDLTNWDAFLLEESGLPGPRGNLELAQVAADLGTREMFDHWRSFDAQVAPTNSPYEFLAVCGVIGLGRLVAEGQVEHLMALRASAADSRWRIREAVAMALQRVGDKNMGLLLREMRKWSRGNLLEKRAAAAALCEPRLLKNPRHVEQVLQILDEITSSVEKVANRSDPGFEALKKGLGYCWSVAVVADPSKGRELMQKWFSARDKDIRWIMKENLGKNRLLRFDPDWVKKSRAILEK